MIGPTTNMEMSEVVHKYVRKANKMNIQILRDFFLSPVYQTWMKKGINCEIIWNALTIHIWRRTNIKLAEL